MLTVKTPKPEIITAQNDTFGAYCWACDHKKYGIRTLGNTRQEAIDNFKECIAYELKFSGIVNHENDVVVK